MTRHDDRPLLVLVRHARPLIDPRRPAATWDLHPAAGPDVAQLAEAIRPLGVDGVASSLEPKAQATAAILAERLGLPLTIEDAFREQSSEGLPWLGDEAFRAAVAEHFARPQEAVLGTESSADAARRFAAGVDRARADFRRPVVVTHGRVLCGYLAQTLGIAPLPLWSGLRLPDALLVDLAAGTVEAFGDRKEK